MKYVVVLLLGIVTGIALFAVGLYANPLHSGTRLSPIAVGSGEIISLSYSSAIEDAIMYTNNGESRLHPHPAKVLQLWEAPVRRTATTATVLRNSRGDVAGIGIKFASDSEATNLLNGEAIVDSAWHIYLPGRGTIFVQQSENYWNYVREIVLPAYWSSADNWKGNWHGTMTSGPGALGTARVTGGSGEFDALKTEAIESLTAQAYSVQRGPVAAESRLTIELPKPVETTARGR